MDEKRLTEVCQLLRECRTIQYKLKEVLGAAFFENSRCSISSRLESRILTERLINSTEVLADVLQLPPYDRRESMAGNFASPRRRPARTKTATLPVPGGHSG